MHTQNIKLLIIQIENKIFCEVFVYCFMIVKLWTKSLVTNFVATFSGQNVYTDILYKVIIEYNNIIK